MPQKIEGMADVAYEAYVIGSKNAGIDLTARPNKRVVQTLGYAKASAGTHERDGTLDGCDYSAAADISVIGLNGTQIATWLEELCRAGFGGWFRNWEGNKHCHVMYAGVPMKDPLDIQYRDFFAGRDGLRSHRKVTDEYWFPSIELRKIPKAMYEVSNGNNPQVVNCPLFKDRLSTGQGNGLYFNNEATPRFVMPVIDGVTLCPVRLFGKALGFRTDYSSAEKQVSYDGRPIPLAVKILGGVGHVPVRDLVREVGLKLSYDAAHHKVVVTR